MKAAYADPPYLGWSKAHYGALHPEAEAYDDPEAHKRLLGHLMDNYESWAYSLHSNALRLMLPWCPKDVRVCAWVKPFASFKGPQMAYCWEPVLVFRPNIKRSKDLDHVRDYVIATPPVFEKKNVGATPGQKPVAFWTWLFDALALKPADEFHDLFPGSGTGMRAWEAWRNREDPEQFRMEIA